MTSLARVATRIKVRHVLRYCKNQKNYNIRSPILQITPNKYSKCNFRKMSESCPICLCELAGGAWKLPCSHIFHKKCIRILYRSTKNCYTEDSFERLVPSCPICRRRIHGSDLPPRRKDAEIRAMQMEERLRVISEPAFAQMSLEERPLRLTRELIVLERVERERALHDLMAQRENLFGGRRQTDEYQASTSSGITARRRLRAYMESDSSSSSSQSVIFEGSSQPDYMPMSQEDPNIPKPTYSSGPDPPSPTVKKGLPPHRGRPQPNRVSQLAVVSRSRSRSPASIPIIDLTKDSRTPLSVRPGHPRLQDINRSISIIRQQLHQMPQMPGVIYETNSPPRRDENDSDLDDDVDDPDPLVIFGTWGRGRHIRYRVRWSDGSVSLNRTSEVESVASDLLEAYRRELRRQATARTRERQRLGEAPKIPGRGRGSKGGEN